MRLSFSGDIQEFEAGIAILFEKYDVKLSSTGHPIEVVKGNKNTIKNDEDSGYIEYVEKIHFFRSLKIFIEQFKMHNHFNIVEYPQFKSTGSMIDLSRNAVLSTDELKDFILLHAELGLDRVLLYMEDTYTVNDYPYFGYMRGKYSYDELKSCDDFASLFGIELVPCIQTLAHLKHALKWNYASSLRDTEDILLADSEETYTFLFKLIESASKPFRTNKIHIGMDEAHQLGLGNYLRVNGYRSRFEIMNSHLNKVTEITNKLNLEAMMWSDMYFRLGSETNQYYDENSHIPKQVIENIPDVDLVYWDYYHTDQAFYERFIQKHKLLKDKVVFAGGAWTWNGISPNFGKAYKTTEASIRACKQEEVSEVFITIWGDDGAETPYLVAYPTLHILAEHSYYKEPSKHWIKKRFSEIHQLNLDELYLLNYLDEVPGVSEGNYHESNPSKFLLWQDILLGLYDNNIKDLPISDHYNNLTEKLKKIKTENVKWKHIIKFYTQLSKVLSLKSELGIKVKKHYESKNKSKLRADVKELEELSYEIDLLHSYHQEIWYTLYKPFGFEIIDIRYGGLKQRIKTAQIRLNKWLNNELEYLAELEEERLYYEGPYVMPEGSIGRNLYKRIISASDI